MNLGTNGMTCQHLPFNWRSGWQEDKFHFLLSAEAIGSYSWLQCLSVDHYPVLLRQDNISKWRKKTAAERGGGGLLKTTFKMIKWGESPERTKHCGKLLVIEND